MSWGIFTEAANDHTHILILWPMLTEYPGLLMQREHDEGEVTVLSLKDLQTRRGAREVNGYNSAW